MTNLLERLTINFLNGLMVLMLVEKAATLDVVRMAREAVLCMLEAGIKSQCQDENLVSSAKATYVISYL